MQDKVQININKSNINSLIDGNKIKTLEDVQLIVKLLNIIISTEHPMYDELKHLM